MSFSLPLKSGDLKLITGEMQRMAGASSEERPNGDIDGAPAHEQPRK
jgi:hypothetical protein